MNTSLPLPPKVQCSMHTGRRIIINAAATLWVAWLIELIHEAAR